jgi:hypothetical protein
MATCPAGHESASDDYCDTCGRRMGGAQPASAQPAGRPSPSGQPGSPGGAAPSGALTARETSRPSEPCPNCGTGRSGQFCEACGFDFRTGQAPGRPAPAPIHGAPTISAPVIRHRAASRPAPSRPAPSQPASSQRPGGSSQPSAPAPQQRPAAPVPDAPFRAGPVPAGSARPARPAAGDSPDAPDAMRWSAVVSADRAYYEGVRAAGGTDAADITFPEYCPQRHYQLSAPQMRIGRISPSRGYEPEIDLTGPPADPGVSRLHAVLIPEPDGTWAILDPGSENGTLVNSVEIPADQRVRLHHGDRVHLGAWTVLTIHAV